MHAKIAWKCSARALEASQDERLPRLVRRVFVRLGVACFWAALALEGRALEVWRDQRAELASAQEPRPSWGFTAGWGLSLGRLRQPVEREPTGDCPTVAAWSLSGSRRIRGLGLGSMWAVL